MPLSLRMVSFSASFCWLGWITPRDIFFSVKSSIPSGNYMKSQIFRVSAVEGEKITLCLLLDFAHVQMTGVYTAASCTSPPPSSCLFFRCQIWGVALVFVTRLKPVAFTCPSFKVKSHTLLLWQRCSNSQKRNSLLIKNYNISFCILPTIVSILILFNVYIYLTCLFTRLHMYL